MKKILLCDDDSGIVAVMKIMLETAGYEVATLNNGKAILKKVAFYKPDLLLLDIWMPGIDGKEIAKLLKRDENFKDIPIIVISALNDTQEIASEIGAEGFLTKPFDMNHFLALVERHTHN